MMLPHIESIGFTSADAEASAAFFVEVLGFQPCGQARIVDGGPYSALVGLPGTRLKLLRLAIGSELLELTEVLALGPDARPGRPIPADSRSNDLWFQHGCLVVNDMAAALARLQPAFAAGRIAPISAAPQRLPDWNTAAAGIVAYKFRDPEGHPLELLQFPPDKGEARWHEEAPGPLLGLDHSAIGIADTAASACFYRELLGLAAGGDGVNSGPEQDGLDGLAATRVRITSHRCPSGAGVECLDYREPGGGRPMPADQGPQDIAHWQLRLRVADLEAIADRAEALGGRLISGGIIELGQQAEAIGAKWALQLADPDGHRLQLLQG
ncbi:MULTISPECIES: VOC family protein [unclassified Cyanobium]|uniref:VOC family protein n=1 Tax=unclassified Cyanobium TaxID=2627006 RepID=UPI0020CDD9A4|nr:MULTISPECIES: VOC family protein [unclassified Cyanobium]MCP9833928.1 lactoylglutathione lyase [Cyanobium sp. La Preciosa 7G6]MCP9936691.1 lactoylglutathione lyase [Cyanobium sp. Aljojuca 7A6]